MDEKNNVVFSIIIPVYNVEKYLSQCIESVLNQTFSNYEVILVDDGSTDSSGQKCDDFANKNSRVKVIHKDNGGLSSARNAGLDIAVGEYILFMDSDDFWIGVNVLSDIFCKFESTGADTLIFPMRRYYDDSNTYTDIQNNQIEINAIEDASYEDAVTYMIKNNVFRASACNKVVKKNLIDNHRLRFLNGYVSEDLDWCGYILLYSKKFAYYDNPIYAYRQQRIGSITTQRNSEKLIKDKLFMCKKGYKEALAQTDLSKKYLLASYYAYEYAVLLGISSEASEETQKEIKEIEDLLNYDLCKKVKIVKKVNKLIGLNFTRKILCFFVKYKK